MQSSSLLHKSFHHVAFTSLALKPCEIIQKGWRSVIFWQNKPCHFVSMKSLSFRWISRCFSVQQAVFRINVQKIWIKPRYNRLQNFMRARIRLSNSQILWNSFDKTTKCSPFSCQMSCIWEKYFIDCDWLEYNNHLSVQNWGSALQIEIHVMPLATFKWLWHAVWVVPCSHQPSFSFWR